MKALRYLLNFIIVRVSSIRIEESDWVYFDYGFSGCVCFLALNYV